MKEMSTKDVVFEEVGTNSKQHVSTIEIDGVQYLKVMPEAINLLTKQAFHDINYYMRNAHLKKVAHILDDTESSNNDKIVAGKLLKNADISADGILPMCQDTGTAIVLGFKGQYVLTNFHDEEEVAKAIASTYETNNLRYSQLIPKSMYEEEITQNNLPAQIDLMASSGGDYNFLFVAKGGGSANKTFYYPKTAALLKKGKLLDFLIEQVKSIGTAACPPYHLAIVIGGTSAEFNLKMVKLASCGYLDTMQTSPNKDGSPYRDLTLEAELLEATQKINIGAQFGGKYFCLDVKVIRCSRHGASLPIGVGVSCSADRQVLGKITKDGIFLEQLEKAPGQFLYKGNNQPKEVPINLNRPMAEILKEISQYPVMTALSLTGKIVVARDMAHSLLKEEFDKTGKFPQYIMDHPVYYAGPAKTPNGYVVGSLGPTTSGRMDDYMLDFQKEGASLISIGKGNRASVVKDSCQKYGGFYLGSIGGVGALISKENIKNYSVKLAFEKIHLFKRYNYFYYL